MQIFRLLLLPFSVLYGLVVRLRNAMYDKGIFTSKKGALPTVIVGNISVGGTGKTPHTLWLTASLMHLNPAILSRGYGRKTKGFRWVQSDDDSSNCGDEPLLYKKQFNHLHVAVSENRVAGIQRIADESDARLVILDDAMQHRKLRGDYYIALVHIDHMPFDDFYLPVGCLRDHKTRLRDANVVIVTHLDEQRGPEHPTVRSKIQRLKESHYISQDTPIYTSTTRYAPLRPAGIAFAANPKKLILITAIARADRLKESLSERYEICTHFEYRDHKEFDRHDIVQWQKAITKFGADGIVTTAKDHVRMKTIGAQLSVPVYVQDIYVELSSPNELIASIQDRIQLKPSV